MPVRVAAAVIRGADGQVLLARRRADVHQGGLWEFPGGKVEAGESDVDALARELHEELGITIDAATPLIRVRHAYPDKLVDIATLEVSAWRGEPHGREGQAVRWVAPHALAGYRFPDANRPILTATLLPRVVVAVGGATVDSVEAGIAAGARLLRLAGDAGPPAALAAIVARCRRQGARVMIEGSVEAATTVGADGAHLPAACMATARATRPGMLLSACVRDAAELDQAASAGVDFVYAAADLDAAAVRALTTRARMPVYAPAGVLGVLDACRAGCQGSAVTLPDARNAAPLDAVLAELSRGLPGLAVRVGNG